MSDSAQAGNRWDFRGNHPAIERWLTSHNFSYNPFSALDAASDPNLHHYTVQVSALEALWIPRHVFVFEPKGGGKTALRVRTVQNCYVGQQRNRPFPVSYLPPYIQWGGTKPSPEDHIQAILQSAAKQLFVSFVYRPHWFLELNKHSQRLARSLLDNHLSGPLVGFLDYLNNENDSLELFRRRFGIVLPHRSAPATEQVQALRAGLLETPAQPLQGDLFAHWRVLLELVLSTLGLPSLYLLVDGLDADSETAADPDLLIASCAFLWESLPAWTAERVFIKAFLPAEASSQLLTTYPKESEPVELVHIEWTHDLLVEMIARRIDVATKGQFSSLNPLCGPDWKDAEHQIVEAAKKLPRDVLSLLLGVLYAAATRGGAGGRLRYEDFETAKANLPDNLASTGQGR